MRYYQSHHRNQVAIGYVSTCMGDCLSALHVSLMALQLTLVDHNPFRPFYSLDQNMGQIIRTVKILLSDLLLSKYLILLTDLHSCPCIPLPISRKKTLCIKHVNGNALNNSNILDICCFLTPIGTNSKLAQK